ncbi:hypothetical protein UFOVP359_116 [uncultured Caudovirales phage]|uniref:Uncharacterized protein n=1 Tax=uncultured Caudovirales phage TaxID=2100421 RepID=A0A6J7WYT9_9CAUD|nr:hypothetical protein UFOVP359_116 [uncultured Caudovirales phage]
MGIFGISSSGTPNDFEDDFLTDPAGPGGFEGAEDGSRWFSLRGIWSIVSGKAKTTSVASSYPIASIYSIPDSPLDQDVVITLRGTTPGSGAALWISDNNNWWAVTTGVDAAENCQCDTCAQCATLPQDTPCTTGFCSTPGNCINGPCNTVQNQNFNPGNPNFAPGGWNAATGGGTPGGGNATGVWNAYTGGGNANNYNCNAWNTGNCNPQTCRIFDPPVAVGGGTCRTWRNAPLPRNCIAWNTQNFVRPCSAWNTCDVTGNRFCRASSIASWNPRTGNNQNFNPSFTNPFTGNNQNVDFTGTNPATGTGVWNVCTGGFCSGAYNCAAYTCTAWSCVTFTNVSCNCQTCFPSYVRVIKSVAGTVTELTKWVVSSLGTQLVNSMRITTSGAQITVEPYANADLTSKIGSDLVYTPTGVTLTSIYGIIVEPSPTSQGSEIDEITIEKI